MRIANIAGRAAVVEEGRYEDVEEITSGRFGPDPMSIYREWDLFAGWLTAAGVEVGRPVADAQVLCPVPNPAQVFALAVNYKDHATEASVAVPEHPVIFTKFPSSISGPYSQIELPTNRADWEVELVVVIGKRGFKVPESEAWQFVAGVTVGQDISERRLQFRPPFPHLSLAKSFPGFGPIGPVVVSPEELIDRDSLRLSCSVNGEVMQDGNTADLNFPVAKIIAEISSAVQLLPGDLIFTGTPSGTGSTRDPRLYLRPGDIVESAIPEVGTMRNRCVEPTG